MLLFLMIVMLEVHQQPDFWAVQVELTRPECLWGKVKLMNVETHDVLRFPV